MEGVTMATAAGSQSRREAGERRVSAQRARDDLGVDAKKCLSQQTGTRTRTRLQV